MKSTKENERLLAVSKNDLIALLDNSAAIYQRIADEALKAAKQIRETGEIHEAANWMQFAIAYPGSNVRFDLILKASQNVSIATTNLSK